jgi:hypothetical protein
MSVWPLRYRHGNETVEAFRWTGEFTQCEEPQWSVDALDLGTMRIDSGGRPGVRLMVMTPSGWTVARPGDWIVRRPSLQMEVCSNDIFFKRCAAIPRLIRKSYQPRRDPHLTSTGSRRKRQSPLH